METLTLTQREQARLQVLNSLLAGHMTMDQAATLMGVSTRHTRRILAAYREEGAAALSHGNRGLRATNATPETTKAEVLRLARSLSEKQCSKRYASLVECKDANYSTTKSRLL